MSEQNFYRMYEFVIDNFPCDVTNMRKFDYYSADHTLGGSQAVSQ